MFFKKADGEATQPTDSLSFDDIDQLTKFYLVLLEWYILDNHKKDNDLNKIKEPSKAITAMAKP